MSIKRVRVIDSHTEGEPTRVVIEGGPELVGATLAEKARDFRDRFDEFRTGVVCEPRGADAVVGALLLEPSDASAQFGVIFFNNVSTLGMCGHGTIGLVRTLQYLGKVGPGDVMIDTPAGVVRAVLHEDDSVSVFNVRSYRSQKCVTVEIEGYGEVTGDVAYGGNWFFLADAGGREVSLRNLEELTRFSTAIRKGLAASGVTGDGGAEIDHVELFGPPGNPISNSRSFVLCPGLAYDRSPCGTGTSAKLACLYADGKLVEGQVWRQESVIGSVFEGRVTPDDNGVYPEIRGRAYITADSQLIFDPQDPFRAGIVP